MKDQPRNRDVELNNDHLIRIIAHEIRNPLTAIKMSCNFLQEGIRENKDREMLDIFVEITANNAGKIEQLVKRLLALKEEDLSCFAPVEICQIIDEAITRAKDRIFLQNVMINKSYTPGHFINGNAEKLTLAFVNILINAIESMEKPDGKLWISVYRVEENIKIIFKDNGKGMEPEVAARIFERQYTSKPDGWGFGLTHAHEILDEHNAKIAVSSAPGKGTSVIITFDVGNAI